MNWKIKQKNISILHLYKDESVVIMHKKSIKQTWKRNFKKANVCVIGFTEERRDRIGKKEYLK